MIKRIRTDVKEAMRNKDIVKRDVLKMVLNKANMLAKDAKVEVPTDEMVLDAIKKEIKQIDDTLDILKKNAREESELYVESSAKKKLLQAYLPVQMDSETLKTEINAFLNKNGIDRSNKGAIMKAVMPVFKAKADGKLINQVVSEILFGSASQTKA